jgi:nicotinate-nucleotide pyrophosphorylase (carboxylating)
MIDPQAVRRAVRAALDEDIGPGDLTSRLVIEPGVRARGDIVAREPLVVAGMSVAREAFLQVDESLDFRPRCDEAALRERGEFVATVEGTARSILAAERTALNFLQRMCGIAAATRRAVGLLRGARVQISATRKTAPGLRALDKYAVEIGGGTAHRQGLFDAVLIKDNHWRLAGGVERSIERARREMARDGRHLPIEIETGTLDEVEGALRAGAEAILLDNMDRATLERAVSLARDRAFLEVSGGIRDEDITALAALGVDRISLGSLTHSVRAADLALELRPA